VLGGASSQSGGIIPGLGGMITGTYKMG